MALVTGFYLQTDGTPLPENVVPLVEAIPDRAFYTLDGKSISLREQEVTPDATTGTYVFDLEPTVNALERGVHYTIRGSYLDPKLYKDGAGAARVDHFEQKVIVPLEGGSVGDLTVVPTDQGLVWVGSTPPPMSMLWNYVDPAYDPTSGLPLPVYTAPDGSTVEHGELVEWGA